jgi:hypothetical protein
MVGCSEAPTHPTLAEAVSGKGQIETMLNLPNGYANKVSASSAYTDSICPFLSRSQLPVGNAFSFAPQSGLLSKPEWMISAQRSYFVERSATSLPKQSLGTEKIN